MNKTLDSSANLPPSAIAPVTLPGRYYFDPSIYQQEQDKVFARTWQYVYE